MSKAGVLLVVEGERAEVQLAKAFFGAYGLEDEYSVYAYGTCVHDLYERMFSNCQDTEDLSLLGVLKEMTDDPGKRSLLDGDYSDVFLVFDYDPHDNRFNPDALEQMAAFFCESTDQGMLYINYPMVESCRDFSSLPDPDYLARQVSYDGLRRYKEAVGDRSCVVNFHKDFSRRSCDIMIGQTVEKACVLAGLEPASANLREAYEALDLSEVLKAQNRKLASEGAVGVLGTFPFVLCNYSSDLVDLNVLDRLGKLCDNAHA